MSFAEKKQQLRRQVRQAAADFDARWRGSASSRIWDRLERLPEFASADVVALYWSLPDEPDSHDFVLRWAGQKQILLPAICGGQTPDPLIRGVEQGIADDPLRMVFRRFDPSATLIPGAFGICECTGDEFPPQEIDLIVIPGVAFDSDGNRIGRGKGFYDRYLCRFPDPSRPVKVGVCFPYQLLSEIPTDAHDMKMDKVIY